MFCMTLKGLHTYPTFQISYKERVRIKVPDLLPHSRLKGLGFRCGFGLQEPWAMPTHP